eukprot:2556216-Rhodomonas_salina.1
MLVLTARMVLCQGGAVALTSGLLLQVLPSGTVLRRHYTVSGTDYSAPGTDYRRVPDYGAWCLVRTTESLRGVRYRIGRRYAMSGTSGTDVRVLRQDEPIGGIVGLSTWLPSLVDGYTPGRAIAYARVGTDEACGTARDGLGQEVAAKTEVMRPPLLRSYAVAMRYCCVTAHVTPLPSSPGQLRYRPTPLLGCARYRCCIALRHG